MQAFGSLLQIAIQLYVKATEDNLDQDPCMHDSPQQNTAKKVYCYAQYLTYLALCVHLNPNRMKHLGKHPLTTITHKVTQL